MLTPGTKVHYAPKPGVFVKRFENGIIHSLNKDRFKRNVVYYCMKDGKNDWENYKDYPFQETFIENLKEGWVTPATVN